MSKSHSNRCHQYVFIAEIGQMASAPDDTPWTPNWIEKGNPSPFSQSILLPPNLQEKLPPLVKTNDLTT